MDGPRTPPAGWRVSTVAGDGAPLSRGGGAAQAARFGEPFGVAVDREGNVYVADAGEGNRILRLAPDGALTALAGGAEGFADGAGSAASFNTPSGLAADGDGNLYVADTGNNRIRKVTKEGVVTTLAGEGTAGFRDGPAAVAQFDAPVGVAVDRDGRNVYVADTYNDRVRRITPDGQVKTIAGAGKPGHADGDALTEARFDTPCGLALNEGGELFIADTGNNRLRKLTKDGRVTTINTFAPVAAGQEKASEEAASRESANQFELSRPLGLALTEDGFVYVAEMGRGRVTRVAPDGAARAVAGSGSGYADGLGEAARFNQPAGLALSQSGALYVADSANFILRKLLAEPSGRKDETAEAASAGDAARAALEGAAAGALPPEVLGGLPRLDASEIAPGPFPWPLAPQGQRHELVATMGEVRGSFSSDDPRHHLHSGIDVFGANGETVHVAREEKVSGPLSNWAFGDLNEGLRVGLVSYIHIRVGRDEKDEMLEGVPFIAVRDEGGKLTRVRVRRGTRLRVGDRLGTVNRMFHVHLNLGPPGAELNPLRLRLAGFTDRVAPLIERDGIRLFDERGARLTEKRGGRLLVGRGRVRIVVDAYDRADGNAERRRLGLYRLGYQLLRADGAPAPGFEQPRVTIEFDRLPPDREAVKLAFADQSGITVYGSKETRFFYEVTNTVRGGRAEEGRWDTSALPPGDYVLRVVAADFAGNEAGGNELAVTVE